MNKIRVFDFEAQSRNDHWLQRERREHKNSFAQEPLQQKEQISSRGRIERTDPRLQQRDDTCAERTRSEQRKANKISSPASALRNNETFHHAKLQFARGATAERE